MTKTVWEITEKQSGITLKTDCPQCAELIIETNDLSEICVDCANWDDHYTVQKEKSGALTYFILGCLGGALIDFD